MKISQDVKLDFDDVLLKPKRSVSASRQDIHIYRDFQFYHSERIWNGFSLMAANMDCTGTFAMAEELSKLETITCLHKHYTIDNLVEHYREYQILNRYTKRSDRDWETGNSF